MAALSHCLALIGLLAAADGSRTVARRSAQAPDRDWPSTKFYAWEAGSPHRGFVSTVPASSVPHLGWTDEGSFFAFGTNYPGMTKIYIWQAEGPSRMLIRKSIPSGGWWFAGSFYAFDSEQPNTTKYYVWSTDIGGARRGIIKTGPACCGWEDDFVFWAYASPPGHVVLCSDIITKVTGEWASLGTIVAEQTRRETYGTQITSTLTNTSTYLNSVSVGIEVGAEVDMIFKSITGSVSTEFRHDWSRSYTNELSTTRSSSTTFEIVAGREYQGKHLWQFQFETMDSCMSGGSTFTQSYAFTESKASGPCCYPGHCRDAAIGSCSWCTSGHISPAMLGFPQCKEGDPHCEEGAAVQLLHHLPGFVRLPQQLAHDEQLTMLCPDRFSGEVVLQCELGAASILAQSCRQN